ncbi:hypothetical protein LY71_1022 [Geodermatophilus tzadiensis]|uniref:Uncharacterized protein n=1 Tax=Geodermatophilus tzadiensis TaxID=1137988 RepID=A0A2T0TZ39_9ACTN|nr:hypothetical protein [Geodermatophilus tzadiensis]PRY50939.1 hypothetical protein LY71_1022 [Geodermatophilus tzadiensis]
MSHPPSVDPSWEPPAWTPQPAPGTPGGAWTPWGTWDPAAGRAVPAPGPVPAPPASAGRPLLTVLAATAVGTAGLVVAAVLGTLVLSSAADDVGRGIGEGMAEAVGAQAGLYADPYPSGGTLGPVEQSDPVEPGELGPDPVLDAYAQSCFDGDLQACDDLFYESPPQSGYEDYGSSCGGRVRQYEVPSCTDLD